jgi:methionine-rich copper-binding protein CopC
MTDERIIAYLLEELPEEESEQFEDECFAQDSWPVQLNHVEEDLIDAYLRDELTLERRQRFERNYLTTEARQERVRMAAALLRHVDEYHARAQVNPQSAPVEELTWTNRWHAFWRHQTRTLSAAAALALTALIVGALWFYVSRNGSPQTFVSLILAINKSNNRAEGALASKVKLPLAASALRIFLTLPEQLPQAARYRVELENDRGETKPLEITGRDARSVSVVIPAAQLARGQYALKLFAIKADGTEQRINGSYLFTVE